MEPLTKQQCNRMKQKRLKHHNKVKRLRKLQKEARRNNRR